LPAWPTLASSWRSFIVFYLATIFVSAVASFAMRKFLIWRLFFAIQVMMFAISLRYWVTNKPDRYIIWLSQWSVFGLLLLLAGGVLADWRGGRSRDWAHWVGVLVTLVNFGVVATEMVWYWAIGS
jgi:hypothetical protein